MYDTPGHARAPKPKGPIMAAKTWDYLSKIQALLATAENPATTPEAAATYRAKAEQFMRLYRVEEENLIATDATSVEPIYVEQEVCDTNSPFRMDYRYLLHLAAEHAGARIASWTRNGKSVSGMVGYEGDVRLAAYLFAAARMVFASRLEPEYDPALSDAENVYRLRSSGMTRQRVGQIVFGDSGIGSPAAAAKVTRMYAAECAARGEDPVLTGRGVDLAVYRKAYGRNFTYTFADRLREARDAADSTGGPLVLHGRQERVEEAFYVRFPSLRPAPPTEVATTDTTPVKAPKYKEPTKAEQRKTERLYHSKAAQLGGNAGDSAAREIELDRASNARRLQETETAGEIAG